MRRLLTIALLCGLAVMPARAAVSCSNLTSAGSATDATSYATASVTPGANHLILVGVVNTKATTPDTPTITGNGLTYVQVTSITFNVSVSRLTIFRAMGGSPTTGALTIDFAAVTQTGAAWSVLDCSGTRTDGSNGDTSVMQSVVGSTNATSLTITLGALDDATNNASVGFFGSGAASTYTAGSGYTVLGQSTYATPASSEAAEWDATASTSVAISIAVSAQMGGVALEIAADTGTENRRPTADSDPGFQSGCTLGTNQASASGANGWDGAPVSSIGYIALGTFAGVTNNKARLFLTWASASGAYSSLNLKVRSKATNDSVNAGGNTTIRYSTNGGGAWTTVITDDSTGGWAAQTTTIALSAGQDLSQLRVLACASGYGGDGVNPGSQGDGTTTVYDIRTEGVLGNNGPSVLPRRIRF